MTDEYCPTRGGSFTAYSPQWRRDDRDDWHDMPVVKPDKPEVAGIPYPPGYEGVFIALDLVSYAQAEALRWAFVAVAESRFQKIETRIQSYKVEYDIKAKAGEVLAARPGERE